MWNGDVVDDDRWDVALLFWVVVLVFVVGVVGGGGGDCFCAGVCGGDDCGGGVCVMWLAQF